MRYSPKHTKVEPTARATNANQLLRPRAATKVLALVTASALAAVVWPDQGHAVRQGAFEQVFENDRVVIWSVGSGASERPLRRGQRLPGVLVTLDDGAVRLIDDVDTFTMRDSRRAVLIALKDHRPAPLDVPRGVAPAFPREGATRIIDSDRVVIWSVAWTQGMKTPFHFHDKDVVAIYLGAGTVRSVPPSGEPTATPRSFGETVFLARGRTHVEECIDGPRRDIIIELK